MLNHRSQCFLRLFAATLITLQATAGFARLRPQRGGKAVARPAKAESIADGILTPAMEEKKLVGLTVAVVRRTHPRKQRVRRHVERIQQCAG